MCGKVHGENNPFLGDMLVFGGVKFYLKSFKFEQDTSMKTRVLNCSKLGMFQEFVVKFGPLNVSLGSARVSSKLQHTPFRNTLKTSPNSEI